MAGNGGCMLLAAVVVCLLVAAPPASGAISCGQVAASIGGCINYIRGIGPLTRSCCSGVRNLNALATTTPDRRQACACLKTLSGRIPGLKPQLASGLPGRCGVSVPYPISTSTDCTKVN